jgi:hypothetical protein
VSEFSKLAKNPHRRLPTIVSRATPLPLSQQFPIYTSNVDTVTLGQAESVRLFSLRMALKAARRKLAAAERQRGLDWENFRQGRARLPFDLTTLRQWRNANVRVAKLQFVEIPLAEACANDPALGYPTSIPRPRSHWGIAW